MGERTVIIGAGPAGLAMAGRMRKAGLDFDILEKSNQVANSWANHYERLHLHTIKRFSELPHKPFPESWPDYVPRAQVVEYLQDYARHFEIQPHFNQEVCSVSHHNGKWQVSSKSGNQFESDSVVIATGFNRVPVVPQWPGQEQFEGDWMHSRDYRNAKKYKGKDVLVVGMGNTGAEIALDVWEQGGKPVLAVRSPVHVVPRDFWGRPTQLTAMKIAKLPVAIGDRIGTFLQAITVGDLSKYGLKKPSYPPAAQLRNFGKTPVIDVGTLDRIKAGDIKVAGGLQRVEKNTVHFTDGHATEFDAVILATGYKSKVEDFLEDSAGQLNVHGQPAAAVSPSKPGLYFLGFDAYSSGLLLSINKDSALILNIIQRGK